MLEPKLAEALREAKINRRNTHNGVRWLMARHCGGGGAAAAAGAKRGERKIEYPPTLSVTSNEKSLHLSFAVMNVGNINNVSIYKMQNTELPFNFTCVRSLFRSLGGAPFSSGPRLAGPVPPPFYHSLYRRSTVSLSLLCI